MTQRDFVSLIRSTHKLLQGESSITDRAILALAKGKVISLLRRETNLRRLWASPNLFVSIPCVEMVEVPLSECCSYTSSKKVARSKHKFPKILEGNYGLLVSGVYAPSLTKELKYTPTSRYINILKLNLPKDDYYWFHNNYLYCSNENVELLSINVFPEETISDALLYPDCDCWDKKIKNPCQNPLDDEFRCPSYLLEGNSGNNGVIALVSQSLLTTYFNIPSDKSDDDRDEQTK